MNWNVTIALTDILSGADMNNIKTAFIRKRNENFNVYIEFVNEFGETKQKSLAKYKTKKEAEKHLVDLKSSINNNKFIVSKDITLVGRCIEYINDESKNLSLNTKVVRESMIRRTIEPFFKDTKLKDVTPKLLQDYANKVFSQYSKTSSTHRLSFVKAVLNEAYRLREIQDNPCHFIKTPKSTTETRKVPQVFTREEIKEVIEKIEGENIEIPILLMLTLGLRAGEACALRWKDIDFENKIVRIEQTLVSVNGVSFKEPKTEGSKRVISIPDELVLKLKKARSTHNKYKLVGIIEHDLVCINNSLNVVVPRVLISNWYRFLDKHNIRRIRLHDLRHTHATILVLAGVDFKTISNRLGHSDIKMTMNRYSHVLEEMDRKASKNISNLMFK